ncbi:MAG TPA: hypothetical protein VGD14_11840 [bacterium]
MGPANILSPFRRMRWGVRLIHYKDVGTCFQQLMVALVHGSYNTNHVLEEPLESNY